VTARRLCALMIAVPLTYALAACGTVDSGTGNLSLIRTLNAYVPPAGSTGTLTVIKTNNDTTTYALSGSGGLAFGRFSPNGTFTFVQNGVMNVKGTGNGLSTAMTFTTAPTLAGNGTVYTMVAGGQSGQTGTLAPQFFILSNYMRSLFTIPADSVALRVVNLSLNANAVGLYNTSGGVPTTPVDSAFSSVSYGCSDAVNTYTVVPASQLSGLALVDVTATGTALALSSTSNLSTFSGVAGRAYTIYIYGQPGNTLQPLGATVALDYPVE
jgi:hypothetical protein